MTPQHSEPKAPRASFMSPDFAIGFISGGAVGVAIGLVLAGAF